MDELTDLAAGGEPADSGRSGKRPTRRRSDTVCLAAILKNEDAFVEEWVAHHRLLGVDHFYLYDNDPRQPLKDILSLHRAYVTVRPWLIDHDDGRYPGRTKQLKAYSHCLERDALRYEWITFLDGDEFIALEEHRNLKAFLAEFEGCDSIALNWHVFGHNGHYDDPAGLIIESLTRRMQEPRAMTKSVSRTNAIASIDSAHLHHLKNGCTLVDANKRPYRKDLYPGKTRVARINHYQCRSFTNWMQKPKRGESGTTALDPENAWRFSEEGCLRQFVSQIALNKNEYLDTSMLRHVEPIKHFLSWLRTAGERGETPLDAERTFLSTQLKTSKATSKTIKSRFAQYKRANPNLDRFTGRRWLTVTRLATSRAIGVLIDNLRPARRLFRRLLNSRLSRVSVLGTDRRHRKAVARATAASQARNWPEAISRWQEVVDEFGDRIPAAFLHLSRAHCGQGDLDAAEAAAVRGTTEHPANIHLAKAYAELATARKNWPEAATRWRAILKKLKAHAPAEVYLELSRAYRHQRRIEKAEEYLRRGLAQFPANVRLATSYAKLAAAHEDWPEAVIRWRAILEKLAEDAPAEVYRELSRAYRHQSEIEKAEKFLRRGQAAHPGDVGLIGERIKVALVRKDWIQVSEYCNAALDLIEAEPDRALDKRQFATIYNGLLKVRDYQRLITVVQDLKRRKGESKVLLALEGIAHLRSGQRDTARLHWAHYWERAKDDQKFARQRPPALHYDNFANVEFFEGLVRTNDFTPESLEGRFCIYTALFGEYDELRTPAYLPPGLELICFSDRARDVPGWDVRVVDLEFDNPVMMSRKVKILPYEYLTDYDYSLYIDANIVFLGDPRVAYHHWLKNRPFVGWQHPKRSSLYEETEAILTLLRHAPSPILDQNEYFAEQLVPEKIGLIESCFLWRDHRDGAVRALMEQWWEHLRRFGSGRDQPGLGYLMWKTGVRPAILPDYLGTSRDNEFFYRLPHKKAVIELEQTRTTQRQAAENQASDILDGQRTHWEPPVRPRKRRLTWIYRDRYGTVASTLMRGDQLSEMAKLYLSDTEVNHVNESHLGAQSDSILILTKGFLKEASLDELAGLKARGNIICADYVDDPIRAELHELVDVYIASSISQFIGYSKTYADKLSHLITHHPDPRLNGITGPGDYCNIGYFGEIANARYASELRGIIDFCLISTKVIEASWIPKLRHCNMHYAVRNRRVIDGFKPFLKGFTAAQCHSNIIVPKDESDARYYLGSDYPYILNDDTLPSVLEMINYAKASFGGKEWNRGLEIMKSVRQRCSPEQIKKELKALVNAMPG